MFVETFHDLTVLLGKAILNCRFFYAFIENEPSLSKIFRKEIKKISGLPFTVVDESLVDVAFELTNGGQVFVEIKRGELESCRVVLKKKSGKDDSNSAYLQTFSQKGIKSSINQNALLKEAQNYLTFGKTYLRGLVPVNRGNQRSQKKVAIHCNNDPFAQVLEYKWYYAGDSCSTYALLYFGKVKEIEDNDGSYEKRLISFSLYQVDEVGLKPQPITVQGQTFQFEQVEFTYRHLWSFLDEKRSE